MPADKGLPLLARATRVKVLPLIVAPVVVGTVLAWERRGVFAPGWFALALAGSAAMHLAANVLNDLHDEATGADNFARRDHVAVATGSGAIGSGALPRTRALMLIAALYAVAGACGAALAIARGPEVLVLGGAGFLLAYSYSGPPLRYGYVGRGLGEIGIVAAFGVLPVMGAYFVQARHVDTAAWVAGVVPGLAAMLVFTAHNFLHFGPDREARKMTPIALLGPEAGLALARIFVVLFVLAVAGATLVLGLWPPGGIVAALAVLPIVVAQNAAAELPGSETYVRVLGASLGACMLADGVLVLASVARVLLR